MVLHRVVSLIVAMGFVILVTLLTACSGGDSGSDQLVNSGDDGGNTLDGPANPGGDGSNTPADPANPVGDGSSTPTDPTNPGGDGGDTPTDPTSPDGDGGNTPIPLTYTGNTNAAVITGNNGGAIASNIAGGSFATGSESAPHTPNPSVENRLITLRYFLRHAIYSGPVAVDRSCANGGVINYTNNLDGNGLGNYILDFVDCKESLETVNGEVIFQIDRWDSLHPEPVDRTMNFSELTIVGPTYNFTASGSVRIEGISDSNIKRYVFNIVTRNNDSGSVAKLEDVVVMLTYDRTSYPYSYAMTMTGRLYDTEFGYVDITTPEALIYSDFLNEYPDQGGALLLTGAANSKVKMIPGSPEKVRIEIDANGNDSFDQYFVYYRADVGGELAPNESPDVSRIAILQNNPYTTDDLTVDESLILDPDADPIEFSYVWYRNGVIISGQTFNTLPSDQHVKGDVISVEITATDGTLSATGADSVTTINSPPIISAGENFSVTFGDELRLNGSAIDADNDPLSYTWSITRQPYDGDAVLSDDSVLDPMLIYYGQDEYWLRLTVSDVESTLNDIVIVTVEPMQLFNPYVAVEGPTATEAVAIGDVNGDDLSDVVVTTAYSSNPDNASRVFVYLQNLSGNLDVPVGYPAGIQPTQQQIKSVSIADLNNDGKNDVVTGYENGVGVMLQNLQGSLDPITVYSSNVSFSNIYHVVAADFNNDGLSDVASIIGGAQLDLFLQNNSASLSSPVSYTVPPYAGSDLSYGDVNGDGLNDIVVLSGSRNATNALSIFLQQPDNTLGDAIPYDLGVDESSSAVGVGDINGDNLDDVVLAYGGNRPSSRVAVFYQNLGGTLDAPVSFSSHDSPSAVEIADINGDSRKDILVRHGSFGIVSVYLQNSDGSLMREQRYPFVSSSRNPHGMAIGDINGDGQNDVVVADGGGITILYHR